MCRVSKACRVCLSPCNHESCLVLLQKKIEQGWCTAIVAEYQILFFSNVLEVFSVSSQTLDRQTLDSQTLDRQTLDIISIRDKKP